MNTNITTKNVLRFIHQLSAFIDPSAPQGKILREAIRSKLIRCLKDGRFTAGETCGMGEAAIGYVLSSDASISSLLTVMNREKDKMSGRP